MINFGAGEEDAFLDIEQAHELWPPLFWNGGEFPKLVVQHAVFLLDVGAGLGLVLDYIDRLFDTLPLALQPLREPTLLLAHFSPGYWQYGPYRPMGATLGNLWAMLRESGILQGR